MPSKPLLCSYFQFYLSFSPRKPLLCFCKILLHLNFQSLTMKKSGIFAVAAASATAISATSPNLPSNSNFQASHQEKKDHENSMMQRSSSSPSSVDKFAPRFDGLRFIETLITAHR